MSISRVKTFGRQWAIEEIRRGGTVVGFSPTRAYYDPRTNLTLLPDGEYSYAVQYLEALNDDSVKEVQKLRQSVNDIAEERDAFKKVAVNMQIRQVLDLKETLKRLMGCREQDQNLIKDLRDKCAELRKENGASRKKLNEEQIQYLIEAAPSWLLEAFSFPEVSDTNLAIAMKRGLYKFVAEHLSKRLKK